MPSSLFFLRLIANRPNFAMTMTLGCYEVMLMGPNVVRPRP